MKRVTTSRILEGSVFDMLPKLPDESVHCCITSPPYYALRNYQHKDQIGLEESPEEYVKKLVCVFREIKRVLRHDGTFWLNIGDSYVGSAQTGGLSSVSGKGKSQPHCDSARNQRGGNGRKPKDLIGIPWMLAFALRADGWYLRQDIIWHKPDTMPESCRDRCVKAHEYVFLLTKAQRYFFDGVAIQEPAASAGQQKLFNSSTAAARELSGRKPSGNGRADAKPIIQPDMRSKRSVWTINHQPAFKGGHFAAFPKKLVEPCLLAGTSKKGCCSECGAFWVRIVKKRRKATRPGTDTKIDGREADEYGNRDPLRHVTETRTVGWEPTCDCEADIVPCVVLDPFFGAGTVGVVCQKYGRIYVGVELNEEYVQIAKRRIDKSPGAGFGLLGN